MIFRAIQVTERDIATAYDPSLVYDDYFGPELDTAAMHKERKQRIKKQKEKEKKKNKSTTPMEDKEKKLQEREALEEQKREAREMKAKEKIREKRRVEKAKQRARKKKLRPKVFCECKAREFKIMEARRQEALGVWNTWCPPDPTPEPEVVYEQIVMSPEDLPPPPPPPVIEMRDLIIQIDLPPIEPGTTLSDEMYDEEEMDMMGSVEELPRAYSLLRKRRRSSGVVVANSQEQSIRSSISGVSKTPRPRPRSLYDTKPKPKPRVREVVMQTDSDPGPLREQSIQYAKQCVCQPGPNSRCTCKRDRLGASCSCKTPSPLDGGPPCICKPKYGPGFRTRRRKKCKSRKCKKCREKGLSGRDQMAKLRTRDEKMKEEQEKIRIEKAKLKAMKQVQKREGQINRTEMAREKGEMRQAAARLRVQMKEQEIIMKEQKRRQALADKRVKQQAKEQKRQAQRDEDFRRRISEMRKPEAEFCGCKDWQKGLCRIKIPPDILAARHALLKEQNPDADLETLRSDVTNYGQIVAALLVQNIDNSDSEFLLPIHKQSRPQKTIHKYQYETDNYVANTTVSRYLVDPTFEITNHFSLSENDVREARYLNNDVSGSRGKELRSWYNDMRVTCSSSFHKKSYLPQRKLTENTIEKMSPDNAIRKDFKSKCDVADKKENRPQNILTTSAYPRRHSSTPPDRCSEDQIATTSTTLNSKVNKNVKLNEKTKTIQQSARRRRISEHDVPATALSVNNDIQNKVLQPRHRPVCTNVAETVFTHPNDETESIVDINQSILTQRDDSSTSKSGLHRLVEKVLSKRKKDRNKENFRHERQHNCNQGKDILGTGQKVKLDGNRADKFPQGSIKIINSQFTKRKNAKNIVTSLISIFNNSSSRMPKGVSSIMPAQLADSSIAEEPSEGQTCGRPLFNADSSVTSVAERPGLHLLGSPQTVRRAARLRDQTR